MTRQSSAQEDNPVFTVPVQAERTATLEFVADASLLTRETNNYSFVRRCAFLVGTQEFISEEWRKKKLVKVPHPLSTS